MEEKPPEHRNAWALSPGQLAEAFSLAEKSITVIILNQCGRI